MKQQKGFTLAEILIVITIIGIIMAIALPQYKDYVSKARRTDGKSALLNTAQAMEKRYTENTTYNAWTLSAAGTASTDVGKTTSPDGYYTIGFDTTPTAASACAATATTSPSASAYRLCATPTGTQANDSCAILSLDNLGAKGSSISIPAPAGCW